MNDSPELLQKKKDVLWKVIDKEKQEDISLYIWKKAMIDYLIDEEKNELKIGKLLKGLFVNTICSDSVQKFQKISEQINECDSLNELKTLEESILNWTDYNTQSNTQVSQEKPSSNKTTSQTPEHSDNSEHYEIDHFNVDVSQKYREMYNQLKWPDKPDLVPFACAIKWYEEMKWNLWNPKYLTVVDFTKPRRKKRFYVINMDTNTVEHATRVWHWHNSWEWEWATSFSNTNGSEQSNLWFLTTSTEKEDNYKHTWTWLRMYWTEKDKQNNWNAASRWIFMHEWGDNLYSQWCFVLPNWISETILNKTIWGSLLFAYAKSKDYFKNSSYFSQKPNWDVIV